MTYDKRHGGPYDRGKADSYYRRGFRPHYFEGQSYATPEVTDLTPEQRAEYKAGYDYNEEYGDHKSYD